MSGILKGCCSCRPSAQFCCGCSLAFGAKLILIGNLLINVFYISTAIANIILRVPTIGFGSDLTNQTFNAGFCLFGLPFIVAAFYGVIARQESHVRLYLYYLVLSFILDMVYIVYYMFLTDSCSMMPSSLKKHGAAFACGMTRTFTILFIFFVTIIQCYCIFTIWSMAEDIRCGGSGSGFPELLASKGRGQTTAVGDGIFGTYAGAASDHKANAYGSIGGMGGGSTLFGGSRHDVNYPPKQ